MNWKKNTKKTFGKIISQNFHPIKNSWNASKSTWILWAIFLGSIVIRFLFIRHPHLIRDDDSYYAIWSNCHFISTPDHPAFIGYMIKPFLFFFGNTRFAYSLSHYGTLLILTIVGPLAINKMIKNNHHLTKNLPGMFFALSMSVLPYFAGISVIISTETPLIFFAFSALFCYFFAFFQNPNAMKWWLMGGFFLAMALFSKLTALFVAIGIFSFPILSKNRKQYLTNRWLYLSALPIIIMGTIIFINDYFHHFSLIHYTIARAQRSFSYATQWDKPFGVFFSQFTLFSPLIVIFIATIMVKTLKNYWQKNNENYKFHQTTQKNTYLSLEQQFFFVAASLLPFIYAIYKISTTFLGSYWISFAYPPMLLLCCFKMAEKWQKNQWKKRIVLNYLACFFFITFVYVHTLYGVVDPQYRQLHQLNTTNKKNNIIYIYNSFWASIAHFCQKYLHQIPLDNTDRYYDYLSIVKEFPIFYRKNMQKNIPILTLGYPTAAIINFFVHPKKLAGAFSPKSLPNWDQNIVQIKPNIFDYIYDFSEIQNKDIYLIVENKDTPVPEILQKISPYCQKAILVKTFNSLRKKKKLRRYLIFYLSQFKTPIAEK